METIAKKEEKQKNVFQKILEDKRAIRECIRNKGDLKNWKKNVALDLLLLYKM